MARAGRAQEDAAAGARRDGHHGLWCLRPDGALRPAGAAAPRGPGPGQAAQGRRGAGEHGEENCPRQDPAGPAAAAGGDAPAAEAVKEEKKEEAEDVDMGGLFGDDDDY